MRRLAPAALLAATLFVPARGAPAGEPAFRPLPAYLEGLSVGPAAEFRHLVIHGLYVPVPEAAPADGRKDAVPAAPVLHAPAEATAVAPLTKEGRTRITVRNLAPTPYVALVGDVIRAEDADYAVTERTILKADGQADVLVVRASRIAPVAHPDPDGRKAAPDAWRGSLPGPALRFLVEEGAREKVVAAATNDLAREAGLETPRRSPSDLAAAQSISPRVIEYATALGTIPAGPSVARRRLVGYAALIDGGLAALETVRDDAEFRALWPDRLRGLAVESALWEVENDVLTKDVEPSKEPDRFLTDVKAAILAVYGAETAVKRHPGGHRELSWRTGRDLGRALVHTATEPPASGAAPPAGPRGDAPVIVQFLLLRDPTQRHSPTEDGPPLDPGVITRKFRRTPFEQRWLDRRNGRLPEPGDGGR
ncbi:MAG: hypothetical protein HMLKMBBP_03320 [Planctomycetes bacterium]|nr:hypothetical protein [Planctomycetota bacterium]